MAATVQADVAATLAHIFQRFQTWRRSAGVPESCRPGLRRSARKEVEWRKECFNASFSLLVISVFGLFQPVWVRSVHVCFLPNANWVFNFILLFSCFNHTTICTFRFYNQHITLNVKTFLKTRVPCSKCNCYVKLHILFESFEHGKLSSYRSLNILS